MTGIDNLAGVQAPYDSTYPNKNWETTMVGATTSTLNDYCYLGITTSGDAVRPNSLCFNVQYTSTTFFKVYASVSVPLNEIVDAVLIRTGEMVTLFMNDVSIPLVNTSNLPLTAVNFNLLDDTVIGNTSVSGGIHKFSGTMYSAKVLRNTIDLSLL